MHQTHQAPALSHFSQWCHCQMQMQIIVWHHLGMSLRSALQQTSCDVSCRSTPTQLLYTDAAFWVSSKHCRAAIVLHSVKAICCAATGRLSQCGSIILCCKTMFVTVLQMLMFGAVQKQIVVLRRKVWDSVEALCLCCNRNFSVNEAEEGKAAAKSELRRRMNLSTADVPIVGVVTRLTHQKGIHLIKHAAWRTLERGGQFVLLGSAPDPKVQAEFNALAGDLGRQYPDRARLWFAYDEPLSHLIYAGCDMFLVPSVFEPCGLTQMIAMRWMAQAHMSVRQTSSALR